MPFENIPEMATPPQWSFSKLSLLTRCLLKQRKAIALQVMGSFLLSGSVSAFTPKPFQAAMDLLHEHHAL